MSENLSFVTWAEPCSVSVLVSLLETSSGEKKCCQSPSGLNCLRSMELSKIVQAGRDSYSLNCLL